VQKVHDDAGRPFAGDPAAAIGDRDEGGLEGLQVADGPSQQLLLFVVLRGKNSNENVCPVARRSTIRAIASESS